uniref:ATP synthase F0 subunit 6 n=1 Tax=Psychoda alternata TaxID=114594 RepID=UPI0022DCE24A|nr:ATP synthase F0 subunit 6 [Psychoda alternata]AQX36170.1 ATP synthase F0 subunit 6 [Psychoda alternata]
MMTNLFSVFDPSTTIFNLSLNWISIILGLFFMPYMYWLMPSRYNIMWNKLFNYMHLELKILLNSGKNTFIFVSLFIFILFNNFLGLFSYIFTSTSHLTLTLTLSIPLWLSFMLYGWINKTNHMFSHLVPLGTPGVLMPFMVCIETISNVIRPGTLAIRLTANMIAGHLLLTLLSNNGPALPTIFVSILLIVQIALLVLESAVAIIQSYVFTVLMTLYSSEV